MQLTARKSEKPKYRKTVKNIVSIKCAKEFTQDSNYRRHLGLIHAIDEDDQAISEEMLRKYKGYCAKRGVRKPRKTKPSGISAASSAKETVILTDSGSELEDAPSELATRSREDPTPLRKAKPDPCVRKKTKPRMPGVQVRYRILKATPFKTKRKSSLPPVVRPLPKTSPKQTEVISSRRRKEMAPSVMAKIVAKRTGETSDEIADDLASRYSWTPEEKRNRINIIRGMRAAERNLCMNIRRSLPMRRRQSDIEEFLGKLDSDFRASEAHDSDEFL